MRLKKKSRLWVAALALMLIPGIVSLLYLRTAPHKPIDSLAVLPFANARGDRDAESLSEFLTEKLTTSLSQLPNLTVISREAAALYKGKDTDARTAGHELGARAIVRGRVERRDDELLVSAELVDSGDNGIIWSQQYGIQPAEIAARQDEIAADIHEHIHFH